MGNPRGPDLVPAQAWGLYGIYWPWGLSLTTQSWKTISWILRIAIAIYMVSHGVFFIIDGKEGLFKMWNAIGLSGGILQFIGWAQIV